MNHDDKLEDFAERELRRSLNKVIFGSDKDGWFAFGRYHIVPVTLGYEVWQHDDLVSTFGSKRSAISWCVADFNRRYMLAAQIQTLDSKKQIINFEDSDGLPDVFVQPSNSFGFESSDIDFKEYSFTAFSSDIPACGLTCFLFAALTILLKSLCSPDSIAI